MVYVDGLQVSFDCETAVGNIDCQVQKVNCVQELFEAPCEDAEVVFISLKLVQLTVEFSTYQMAMISSMNILYRSSKCLF